VVTDSAEEDAVRALPSFENLPLGKLERLMTFALTMGFFSEVSRRRKQQRRV
jgi:hypothetical protein